MRRPGNSRGTNRHPENRPEHCGWCGDLWDDGSHALCLGPDEVADELETLWAR